MKSSEDESTVQSIPLAPTGNTSKVYSTTLEQDNLSAQRASHEAISISHATLETTIRQEEQLHHTSNLLQTQKYQIQKSARILRSMTWSGWVGNLFSKDVPPIPTNTTSHVRTRNDDNNNNNHSSSKSNDGPYIPSPKATSNISISQQQLLQDLFPSSSDNQTNHISQQYQDTISLLINYQTHVHLLSNCQSQDELDTCMDVCSSLYRATDEAIRQCQRDHSMNVKSEESHDIGCTMKNEKGFKFVQRLGRKLQEIQRLQMELSQQVKNRMVSHDNRTQQESTREQTSYSTSNSSTKATTKAQTSLYERILSPEETTSNSSSSYKMQEEHLNILSQNLNELQSMGTNIWTSLSHQNEVLDDIQDGADDLLDQTNMVRRRADRLAHGSVWRSPKSDFECHVLIQHLATQHYLSVYSTANQKYQLCLQPELDNMLQADMCIFSVYKRRGAASTNTSSSGGGGGANDDDPNSSRSSPTACSSTTIGFKSKCTGKWLGQSFMGSVVCSASKFGPREEWELDNHTMEQTKLLCASANWGSGGWLEVEERTGSTFTFSGFDSNAKQKASVWSVIVLET